MISPIVISWMDYKGGAFLYAYCVPPHLLYVRRVLLVNRVDIVVSMDLQTPEVKIKLAAIAPLHVATVL